jgi:hypothetical protein
MPSGLAFRVLPTTRAKLRKAVYRNERIFRTKPPQRHRRRSPNPPRSSSRARIPYPAESERQSTNAAEAADAPPTRAASTPRRGRSESTRWKPLAGKHSCRAARSWVVLSEPPPRLAEPNGDLDASIEVAPSPGFGGLLIDACSRRCCHRCKPAPQIPLLHQTRQNQALELGRQRLLLSILSVGYAAAIDGCPPLTSARQQKH